MAVETVRTFENVGVTWTVPALARDFDPPEPERLWQIGLTLKVNLVKYRDSA